MQATKNKISKLQLLEVNMAFFFKKKNIIFQCFCLREKTNENISKSFNVMCCEKSSL